ncbi:MAG: hypothetical protein ACXV5Q_00140 [Frankiaceae bacterium]
MAHGDQLAIALTCFDGDKQAGAARRSLESRLRSNGDDVLETTVLRVDAKHKASVHDPRRVLLGTVTPALTWGAFGLLSGTDRILSAVVWAVIGAICGGLYAYFAEHLLAKSELARIGARLGAPSSALLTYARTSDAKRLLETSASASPTTGSVAAIDADLGTRIFAGPGAPVELPHGTPARSASAATDETTALSMILYRYPTPKAATRVARNLPRSTPSGASPPQVELVIETDQGGRRRVTDPSHGTAAMARSDVISWGGFGLVFGAIVGLAGGGGILGFLKDGLVTGVGWAVFGLLAGALYGLWAGRSISAGRLRGIGPLLPPGTSALLAWSNGPASPAVLEAFQEPGGSGLVLGFNPVEGGAVLEATG